MRVWVGVAGKVCGWTAGGSAGNACSRAVGVRENPYTRGSGCTTLGLSSLYVIRRFRADWRGWCGELSGRRAGPNRRGLERQRSCTRRA